MKKRSISVFAAVLAAVLFFCMTASAFAVAGEADITGNNESIEAETTEYPFANKAEYYSRVADMNEDWMLNSADARIILRLCARIDWVKDPGWLPKGVIFGDIDENGVLNSADARWALRVAARLNTVSEVIALQAEKDSNKATTVPSTSADTTAATTAPVTTTEPETTNPNYILTPICDEYVLQIKSTEGTEYLIATNGVDVYIRSNDILDGIAVFIDRDGNVNLINESDKEYAPFRSDTIKNLGSDISKIRSFAGKMFIPDMKDIEEYEGYTKSTETIDWIPFTVATKGDVSIYYYADGSLLKVIANDFGGTKREFSVSKLENDASSTLSAYTGYSRISTNMFILKNGLSLLGGLI